MFFLFQPTQAQILVYTESQQHADFNYSELEATRTAQCPAGCARDDHSITLGSGAQTFARAREAIQNWQMFKRTWLQLLNPEIKLEVGATLILKIKHLGFYSLIANRIVYVVDEPRAFGFGYGTLTGQAVEGEERFLLERLEDDRVVFSLFAFSKPRHPLAVLGKPIVRWLQQQGSSAYLQAIKHALKDWNLEYREHS